MQTMEKFIPGQVSCNLEYDATFFQFQVLPPTLK